MSPQWISVVVAALVMLGGTAINLFIIGRFVGQWSEAMKHLSGTLDRVEARVEAAETQGAMTATEVGRIDARVKITEAVAEKFWEMRDAFIRMTTTLEIEGKQQREKMDSIARGQSVIERQLGNLVASKAGFTTIENEGSNR